MTDVDLDSYGENNDLPPDQPAPRQPRGKPDETFEDYEVWQFDAEMSETVPDTYVVSRQPDPLDFRMWVFAGRGQEAHFVMRSSHKYADDEVTPEQDDCCEVLLEDQSLTADHCPDDVRQLVAELTDAPVVVPESETDEDHGGPISY